MNLHNSQTVLDTGGTFDRALIKILTSSGRTAGLASSAWGGGGGTTVMMVVCSVSGLLLLVVTSGWAGGLPVMKL